MEVVEVSVVRRGRPRVTGEVAGDASADPPPGTPGVLVAVSPLPRWERDGASTDSPRWREVGSRLEGQRRGTSAALHWLSETLVVVGPDPEGVIAAAVSALPAEPGTVTVVGELAEPSDWDVLTDVLPIAVPPGSAARLGVSGVAGATRSGRTPAAVLAESLRADVLAPAGGLLLVPGGAMFAAEGWRRQDGQGTTGPAGRRVPAPDWETAVDEVVERAAPGVVAVPVPAGVWLYPAVPGTPEPDEGELPYSVPVRAGGPTVLVGRPGLPAPEPGEIEALIATLPATTLLAPYGPGADVCLPLAAALAARWGEPVEVATGLPVLDGAGRPGCLWVDADGVTAWQPSYGRLRVGADGGTRPMGVPDCLADLPEAGPGCYRLGDRWLVETVQSGLWVRPTYVATHGSRVPDRPWDPDRFVIQVGVPGTPPGSEVLPLLHGLLARFPAGMGDRIVVLPTELAGTLGLGPRPVGPAPRWAPAAQTMIQRGLPLRGLPPFLVRPGIRPVPSARPAGTGSAVPSPVALDTPPLGLPAVPDSRAPRPDNPEPSAASQEPLPAGSEPADETTVPLPVVPRPAVGPAGLPAGAGGAPAPPDRIPQTVMERYISHRRPGRSLARRWALVGLFAGVVGLVAVLVPVLGIPGHVSDASVSGTASGASRPTGIVATADARDIAGAASVGDPSGSPGPDATSGSAGPAAGVAPGTPSRHPGTGANPPAAPVPDAKTTAPGRTGGAGQPTGPAAPGPTTPAAPVGLPNPSGRNLALDQPASASSMEAGYLGPAYAVDGDTSTRWGSAFADPQWISVDLGEVWAISSVRLDWERACATQYRVDVSLDGRTWSTVYSTSSGTEGPITIAVDHEAARYVRVYGTRRATEYGYSLLEFGVY